MESEAGGTENRVLEKIPITENVIKNFLMRLNKFFWVFSGIVIKSSLFR